MGSMHMADYTHAFRCGINDEGNSGEEVRLHVVVGPDEARRNAHAHVHTQELVLPSFYAVHGETVHGNHAACTHCVGVHHHGAGPPTICGGAHMRGMR